MNKVISIVGMTGVGKTITANYIESRGFYKIYFGGMILGEITRRGLPITPETEKKVITELRSKYGNSLFAAYFLNDIICGLKTNNIVIDGLYSWSEYLYLKDHLDNSIIIICIVSDKQLRYQRLASRNDRGLTPEEAEKRDINEIEKIEKGGPISFADYYILNNGSLDELFIRIDQLIKELE